MRHKKTHYNVIMGDFNAKVGKGDEDCVGSFGYGVRNDRGDDLINFATAHGFKIMNTYYKKKRTDDGLGVVQISKPSTKLITS